MSEKITLEGQSFYYNHESHIAKLTIFQPFLTAGKILGWDKQYGTVGLGINKSIVKFILKTKSVLIIRVEEENKEYWIRYDDLKQFLKNYNSEYKAGGKKLVHVIPWKLCNRYGLFQVMV